METGRYGKTRRGRAAAAAVILSLALLATLAFLCRGLEARRERLRAESVLEDCRRAAVEYRARFGAYPASAEALAACGFRYDAERYRIRYTYYGEQIFPGIGLYRKGAAG